MCGHSSTERPRQVRLPGLHHYEKCYSRISRESNGREISEPPQRSLRPVRPGSYRTKMKKAVTVTAASTTMNSAA